MKLLQQYCYLRIQNAASFPDYEISNYAIWYFEAMFAKSRA